MSRTARSAFGGVGTICPGAREGEVGTTFRGDDEGKLRPPPSARTRARSTPQGARAVHNEVLIGEREASGQRLQPSGDEAGTAPGDRRFRPDVQGLRAVAVALVVLFHAHVPGLGGGYVGVDVFFVISGFVITGVLLREHASTGSTSILHFYGRRVRRILPAATLVIIAAVIASYAFLVRSAASRPPAMRGGHRSSSSMSTSRPLAPTICPRNSLPRFCRTIGRSQSKSSST